MSTDTFPMIYHQGTRDTYLNFIKENFILANKFLEEYNLLNEKDTRKRALSLQFKMLIGINAEHLLKIILLKRGFIINRKNDFPKKFNSFFMKELEEYNASLHDQTQLNLLLQKSSSQLELFEDRLIYFDDCIPLFKGSNESNYFDGVKCGKFEGNYKYLAKYEFIDSNNVLNLIKDMRNSYVHKAEGNFEINLILWYTFNFLLFLAKKEFPKIFNEISKIGDVQTQALFP